MSNTIRLLLVDDHQVVRLGLRALLSAESDLEVVGEAGSAAEALAQVDSLRPEVVLMDVRLPDQSGITACQQIHQRWPEVKVLMLTSFADESLVLEAVDAGAAGYVLKQVGNDDLIKAVRAVAQGDAVLDPAVTREAAGARAPHRPRGPGRRLPGPVGARDPGAGAGRRRQDQCGNRRDPDAQRKDGAQPRGALHQPIEAATRCVT